MHARPLAPRPFVVSVAPATAGAESSRALLPFVVSVAPATSGAESNHRLRGGYARRERMIRRRSRITIARYGAQGSCDARAFPARTTSRSASHRWVVLQAPQESRKRDSASARSSLSQRSASRAQDSCA